MRGNMILILLVMTTLTCGQDIYNPGKDKEQKETYDDLIRFHASIVPKVDDWEVAVNREHALFAALESASKNEDILEISSLMDQIKIDDSILNKYVAEIGPLLENLRANTLTRFREDLLDFETAKQLTEWANKMLDKIENAENNKDEKAIRYKAQQLLQEHRQMQQKYLSPPPPLLIA